MKKFFTVFLILFILIWIFWKDNNNTDLGNSYYYLPKYEAIDIGYKEGGIIYKSIKRNIFKNVIIHANVFRVSKNENFIIAIQTPEGSIIDNSDLKSTIRKFNYYIIVKSTNELIGPYPFELYKRKCDSMNIPKSLLKIIDKPILNDDF